jgi:hypothetical protein
VSLVGAFNRAYRHAHSNHTPEALLLQKRLSLDEDEDKGNLGESRTVCTRVDSRSDLCSNVDSRSDLCSNVDSGG